MLRRILQTGALLACLSPLGACTNQVLSERPLFTAADEVGAVPLKRGVWGGHEPDCVFDASKPLADWPSCAGGFVVGRKGLKGVEPEILIDRVAAGKPMIIQFRGDGAGQRYSYSAAEVVSTDQHGRATALLFWPVACSLEGLGPTPAEPAEAVGQQPTPEPVPDPPRPPPPPPKLFRGLERDGQNCLADDPAEVRNAAAESKAIGSTSEIRWLRAGRR